MLARAHDSHKEGARDHSSATEEVAAVQVLKVAKGQKVASMVPVDEFLEEAYLIMLTKRGWIKRVSLSVFTKMRPGSTAIKLVGMTQQL